VLPAHLDTLFERDEADFHLYAFNQMRELGANFRFVSASLLWLLEQHFEIPPTIPVATHRIPARRAGKRR